MMSKFSKLFFFAILLSSCIGEDIIDDFVEAELRILNPIEQLSLSESYQFNVSYFNNIGEADNEVNITWSSSNEDVASISNTGLLSPNSIGTVVITAIANSEDNPTEVSFNINIIEGETPSTPDLREKSGTIQTTSSYLLEGTFVLTEQQNTENLILQINEDYRASTALPGLYLYLSNNPNSIGSAYEVGPVETFNGAHVYNIPNTGINDYNYLLYWCKPFAVKVGDGEILDE